MKEVIMKKLRIFLSVFFTAAVVLTVNAAQADTIRMASPAAPSAHRPVLKPQEIPADVRAALERCFPDPRSGNMRCPSAHGNTPGPEGASCQTSAGSKGIWVKKNSASELVCATPEEACYTGSGGIGKVWAAGDVMTCGAKGDYCVNSKGAGRVFLENGTLRCLLLNDSCNCANGSSGCKVVGGKDYYLSYTCAKGYVSCPGSTTGLVEMTPSNGNSNGAVPVSLQWNPPKTDSASVTCEYKMTDSNKTLGYSIPCHGAYAYNFDNRWRACTDDYNHKTHSVQCDVPGTVSLTADSVLTALGSSAGWGPSIALSFQGSANDSAREHAICNYRVDALTLWVRVPCLLPTKTPSGAYVCN
jgi:hypothetical protein